MKELYCKVHGQVQGVFFRNFAQKEARAFGITGYAKNLPEAETAVEVVAQGDEHRLKLFLERISAGPEQAEVESIDVSWGPVGDEPFSDFSIL